jgi:hypothetical protein
MLPVILSSQRINFRRSIIQLICPGSLEAQCMRDQIRTLLVLGCSSRMVLCAERITCAIGVPGMQEHMPGRGAQGPQTVRSFAFYRFQEYSMMP